MGGHFNYFFFYEKWVERLFYPSLIDVKFLLWPYKRTGLYIKNYYVVDQHAYNSKFQLVLKVK